ncbi:hypothetical protein AB0I55_29340 [Actinocatenispora sera]|uniref:hypothetical protein n=1 Tax=Actinocatenispora sera TaxID=390989 RepID=UPI0033DE0264
MRTTERRRTELLTIEYDLDAPHPVAVRSWWAPVRLVHLHRAEIVWQRVDGGAWEWSAQLIGVRARRDGTPSSRAAYAGYSIHRLDGMPDWLAELVDRNAPAGAGVAAVAALAASIPSDPTREESR